MCTIIFLLILLTLANFAGSQSCSNSNTCPGRKICINSWCGRCSSDADCQATSPQKPYCKNSISGNFCEQCLSNNHCTSATNSLCSGNTCSPCIQQSDCSHIPGKNQCYSGVCVECFDNLHCSSGICDTTSHICQSSTCPCSLTSITPFCAGTYCLGCGASQNLCSSIGLLCSPDGSCKQCWQNDQCNDAALSKCSGNSCAVCSDDTECSHITGKSRCLTSQQCVECLNEYDCAPGETCSNNLCVATSTQSFTIKLSYTEFPDVYTIDFPSELVLNAQVEKGIAIKLLGIDSSSYASSIVKISNTRYEVHFKVTQTIPVTQLYLNYTFYSQIRYNTNSQSQWEAQIASKRIPYISEEEKKVSETIQMVGEKAAVAMAVTSGSILLLGGNPIVLWALISLIQTFYYLTFINVNYPANVQYFLRIFSLGKLDFVPNLFEWIDSNIEELSLPAPARFEEYNVNSFFLEEAGNMIFIALGLCLIYGFSVFIIKTLNRFSRLITLFFVQIVFWFEWSGVFRCLIASYPEFTQASLLQVKEMNFTTPAFALSSVFGIIFSILSIVFPIVIFLLVKKLTTSNGKIPRKYVGLIEDYTPKGPYPRYFTSILLTQMLLIQLVTVFLHDYPYVEISFLILVSLTVIAVSIKFKPFRTKTINITKTASEILFEVAHLIIFVLILDDHIQEFSEQDRLNIGWGLIAICALIFLLNMSVTFMELIKKLIEYWHLMKKLFKKEKASKYNKPRLRSIFPQERFEMKEILPEIRSDSIKTATPRSSFISRKEIFSQNCSDSMRNNTPRSSIISRKEIFSQNRSDSIGSNISFFVPPNSTIEKSSFAKQRKILGAQNSSIMLEHFQDFNFGQ